MIRCLALLLALPFLTACVPEDDTTPDLPELTAAERAACEAEGGRVGIAGLFGGEMCFRPAPDAGQACARASDCTAYCEADTRTCAAELNPFGCYSYLDEDGVVVSICVD